MINHQTFMKIAFTISGESKARKRKVGAIIVKDNNIIAVGYNGTPSGFNNECEYEKYYNGDFPDELTNYPYELITKPEVLHAESNAIAKCSRSTASSDKADIYTTTAPCIECAKLIIQAGISNVFYFYEYKSDEGIKLLEKANIKVCRIEFDEPETVEQLFESENNLKATTDQMNNYFKVRNEKLMENMQSLDKKSSHEGK